MPLQKTKISIPEVRKLAVDACLACGASPAMAMSLVDATVSASLFGPPEVGFPHLIDYLKGLQAGRINGQANPTVSQVLPALIHADAAGGIAQLGFDLVYENFKNCAQSFGVAVFTQKNSFTAGELGYYARRLALDGLMSVVVANGTALMAAAEGGQPVYCTNPLAFGAPLPAPLPPLVIDQAASATAFVNIARAAAKQAPIPYGWAIDEEGAITTDAVKAIRGALLPFGGYKGANIALFVEVLAAGLSGAAWSLDAGDFRSGQAPTNAGLTIIAISPAIADPAFIKRLVVHVERLRKMGVHIPGQGSVHTEYKDVDVLELETDVLEAIGRFAAGVKGHS